MPDPVPLDLFQRLGLALAIGFLVGVERGWKHRDDPEETRVAGLRTHAIIGLLGGVSALISAHAGAIVLAALTLAFAAPWVLFKYRETVEDGDLSVTGAIAGLAVFALGVYAVLGNMVIAAAAGVALTAIMAFKQTLHSWLRALTWLELRSALLILAMSAIALPLLPNHTIDPWHALNPRELWMLTIVLAAASFGAYVAVKLFGGDLGLLAGAAAGAVVSSTAVTAQLGGRVRAKEAPASLGAAGAALAAAVSIGRVGLLVGVAVRPAMAEVAPVLIGSGLAFLLGAFGLRLLGHAEAKAQTQPKLQSPLDLKSVLFFAALLGAIIMIGRMVADHYQEAGLLPFAATAGIADVDAVTLAAGSLIHGGLDARTGAHAILVAVLVNSVSKGVIAALTGGWRYGGLYLGAVALAAGAGGAVWAIAQRFYTPM